MLEAGRGVFGHREGRMKRGSSLEGVGIGGGSSPHCIQIPFLVQVALNGATRIYADPRSPIKVAGAL